MIILGIDPGTTTVGYAVIKVEKYGELELTDYGVLTTPINITLSTKLLEIGTDISKLIQKYTPEIIVIEKLFFQNNIKTAIDVAQARWVMLYEAVKNNITLMEFTPLQVKKAITGHGKAEKLQLQHAIKILFGLDSLPTPDDAADAIGLAYMGFLNRNSL